MSDPSPSNDMRRYDAHRLRRLIDDLCEDEISPAEHAELQETLLASEAARVAFLDDMCLHAGLEWEVAASGKLDALFDCCRKDDGDLAVSISGLTRSGSSSRRVLRRFALLAAAACLLLAASLLFPAVRQAVFAPGSLEVAQGSPPPDAADAKIATISPISDDCRWMFERQSIAERSSDGVRSEVRSGETLRVTSGTLQLTFDHGTAVTLPAPAILEVDSLMRGRLIRGRATVKVARGAEGFTIDTPRTSVIDLGTVFGIEVDDFGATDVVVFSGMVDVAYSREVEDSAETEIGTQRLHMGEALRVDERGTLSRLVSLNGNRFAADGSETPIRASRKPVISSVRDNIDREDAWNFYEIVPEGMREDAKAFVDRLHHEWNGVDEKGMPEYLIGGDYVKTFNDDKNVGDFEVFVTLDRGAELYVLWCQRVPPPSWLSEEFEDTGDVIGVDEGYHVFKDGNVHDRSPGVGPGVSIDSIHSVWRRVVPQPTTIRLGPTEAPGWDFNVYGIVAMPLEDDH